jgi:hypothetical protein
MACIARSFIAFLLIIFFAPVLFAADVKYDLDGEKLNISIDFQKGYSNVNTLKLDSSFVISFESNEPVEFKQTFWDMPITSAFVSSDGSRKRLITEFSGEVSVPEILSQPKVLKISFPFPKMPKESPVVGKQAYAKMIWGLLIIVAIILFLFWLAKIFFKKQVFSDIPGAGRLLGKADIDLRDKIEDEDSVTRIKSGFSKKTDFGNYMKFFKKHPTVKDEVEISRDTINERLKSLKKR